MTTSEHYVFKEGDQVELDNIYEIQGLFPIDCYEANSQCGGEIVVFLKDVEIKVWVKVNHE